MTISIETQRNNAEIELAERHEAQIKALSLFTGNNAAILDEAFEAISEEVDIDPYIDTCQEVYLSFTGNGDAYKHVYQVLRKAGYEPRNQMTEEDKSYFSTWWEKDDAPTLWVCFSSNACHRVAVGTRTVEETIYETVCDD